jgi:hypothetical protein
MQWFCQKSGHQGVAQWNQEVNHDAGSPSVANARRKNYTFTWCEQNLPGNLGAQCPGSAGILPASAGAIRSRVGTGGTPMPQRARCPRSDSGRARMPPLPGYLCADISTSFKYDAESVPLLLAMGSNVG